ncbi:uncharacterized protein BJ171DRAFT_567491, partial [Polychytrium aggregatum]|uniref:uncharacterized protein n=1 Tax=Polychytrium aggregatum TaxID=110093 RepID=UPI0022FEA836
RNSRHPGCYIARVGILARGRILPLPVPALLSPKSILASVGPLLLLLPSVAPSASQTVVITYVAYTCLRPLLFSWSAAPTRSTTGPVCLS